MAAVRTRTQMVLCAHAYSSFGAAEARYSSAGLAYRMDIRHRSHNAAAVRGRVWNRQPSFAGLKCQGRSTDVMSNGRQHVTKVPRRHGGF